MEELERILSAQKVTGGQYPDFFPFENPGDKLLGQFVKERKYEDRPIYEIKDLNGKTWSVGAPTILRSIFEDLKPQPGDFVLITYEGEGKKGKGGRKVKLFSVGKIPEEEGKKILEKAKTAEKLTTTVEKTKEEKPKVKVDEIKEFFEKLFEFYDEMNKKDIEKRIQNRFQGVTFDDIIAICSDFTTYDEKTETLRKK